MKLIVAITVVSLILSVNVEGKSDVTVLTVATDDTHGLQRFLRSAKVYGIDVEVLGRGKEWTGGDMNYAGGGQKINLLKNKINKIAESGNKDKIVLFTDSYDVIFLGSLEEIVRKFQSFPDTRVLFSAEPFCWPDLELASSYPNTTNNATNLYLNSGGFIGYLPELAEIINYKAVNDKEDDQLYYTNIYLEKDLRESLKLKLDHNSTIFQNLNGASDIELRVNTTEEWPFLENVVTKLRPSIVHSNGPSKLILNRWGNYLAKSWSLKKGCTACSENRNQLKNDALPTVMMAVFIEQPTPFFEEFLQQTILNIDYPRSKIHLFVSNNVAYHEKKIDQFFEGHSKKFASSKRIKPSDLISEADAREVAMDRCEKSDCDYLFYIDSLSRVEKNTLRYLIGSGYEVIAPMLVRPGQAWSNFWGAINSEGFYARSFDYMEIVNQAYRGIWNVPYINNCYLIKSSIFRGKSKKQINYHMEDDSDMALCKSLRNAGIFMHVSNEKDFGYLINPDSFDIKRTNPDVYQVIDNRVDWERRYLNENYTKNFAEGRKHLQPCPDVYWFPVMSKRFCVEWIEIMEAFGKWSDGSNNDKRLESGYEAVPTRDIHMNQVGLELQWLNILKEYVRPLQEMVFIGYYHNPPHSIMNFVVRYRPDEQPSLRPHHDASTYTINLSLNTPNIDYEGGGCRFLRYDCTVKNMRQGWLLMHPGRLTHYHEGLKVTNGTRYIMISFVDP